MPTFKANLHNLILILLIVTAGITTPSASHAAIEAVVIGSWCTGSSDPCDAAFRVNLSTGQRTLLSAYTADDHRKAQEDYDKKIISDATKNRGGYDWRDVAISPSGKIFFGSSANISGVIALYSIDASTGDRHLWSPLQDSAYGPVSQQHPDYLRLESTTMGNIIAWLDAGRTNAIFNLDQNSGYRSLIIDGYVNRFNKFLGVDSSGKLYVSNEQLSEYTISQVDALTGTLTEIATFPGVLGNPSFRFYCGYGLQRGSLVDATGKVFCTNLPVTTYGFKGLYVIDPKVTNAPIELSDFNNPNQGPSIIHPLDQALDGAGQILVLDDGNSNEESGIYAVDATTGFRSLLSDFQNISQGPLIYRPITIAIGDLPAFVGGSGSDGGNNDNTGGSTGGNNENTGGNTQNTSVTPSQFGLGTAVTLNGQGFGATKGKLLVGKKTAKLKSWTDASIVFTPPTLRAGNYSVRLRTKRGRAINVTVPDVTVLAPALSELSTTSAKTGDTVTITGNALGTIKPKAYFITGKKKIRVTVLKGFNDTSAQVKIPKLKAGDYQVVVTNPAGSSNALTLQVNSVQGPVNNVPIVPAPGNSSIDESVSFEVGERTYQRAFGRGCGTCHDIPSNPQLSANIKAGSLDRVRFEKVVREGKGGMPKAIDEIMKQRDVSKAGYDEKKALDALYKINT